MMIIPKTGLYQEREERDERAKGEDPKNWTPDGHLPS